MSKKVLGKLWNSKLFAPFSNATMIAPVNLFSKARFVICQIILCASERIEILRKLYVRPVHGTKPGIGRGALE